MPSIYIQSEVLQRLREQYPPGCRVELIEMCDPYRNVTAGLHCIVDYVDDAGGVHVHRENGSSLAAIHDIDRIKRID